MAEEKKREVPPVVPTRIQPAEHGRNVWLIDAESSEHPEDFLKLEFYAHVAKNFRPFDHIEIRTDDGQYWCELLVLAADVTWAKVKLLREHRLEYVEQQAIGATDFEVSYKGRVRLWCVIRKSDKSAVSEGHNDRGAANAWLDNYQRTVGRKAA